MRVFPATGRLRARSAGDRTRSPADLRHTGRTVSSQPIDIAPDDTGRFGDYGGRFVPEVLMPAIVELEAAWREARVDDSYRSELDALLRDYAGRPTPLYLAQGFGERIGSRVWV